MIRCSTLMLAICVYGLTVSRLHALDQKTTTERTSRLEKMSEVERDRFNRNLQEFQKLSDPEKQQLRNLHEQLVEDNTKKEGLSDLLTTYVVWLQTLTPTQRDQLTKETAPAQKLALIRQFKEIQEHPPENESHPEPQVAQVRVDGQKPSVGPAVANDDTIPFQPNPSFDARSAASKKDLKAIMKFLVERLPADQRKEFEDPKLPLYLPILNTSVQVSGRPHREWPDEPFLKDLVGAMSKDPFPNQKNYETKRQTILKMILVGVMKEAQQSVKMPTSDQMQEILESLPTVEKEWMLGTPKEWMEWKLKQHYFRKKGGEELEAFRAIPEYRKQVIMMFNRFEVPLPRQWEQNKGNNKKRP